MVASLVRRLAEDANAHLPQASFHCALTRRPPLWPLLLLQHHHHHPLPQIPFHPLLPIPASPLFHIIDPRLPRTFDAYTDLDTFDTSTDLDPRIPHTFDASTDNSIPSTVKNFQTRKIAVLGGSGFVGSAICKAAVGHGFDVVSLSRSGRPPCEDAWVDHTVWIAGDVFYADWDSLFHGATVAVSTIGGFGIDEQMEKLNGEANLLAINAALSAGIQKFILVSVHDYNVPDIFKNTGYFNGKRKAEAEVLAKFANAGTVLRPGFIYGRKTLNGLQVPLDVVGGVWDWVHAATQFLTRPFTLLPASDLLLAPPVSVNDVAAAAIKAVIDDDVFGIYTIEQIKDLASSM